MLHRSFKPAKCKTALKLAASRIKLLRNKREAQVKQLKRELTQLLEAGQEQTARIRVEHVVREEKTMAAYELIEIYCELIVARLPIIESQKNCPIDLKEAVASIIFASPRCADIPELMDVRKHFTTKFGKEFVSAAVELRPDCGVSRLLVEKLSAKAPDGPTKIKILTTIAEEHNISWDPMSFEEKNNKPPEDLLSGANTFEQASKVHMGPPNVQASPNKMDQGAHNFHGPYQHYEKHDVPVNSYDPNPRSSPHPQNVPYTEIGANKAMPPGDSHQDHRPNLGTGAEGVEYMHSYSGNQSGVFSGRQSWNMEFKDATAAAQAAAESAERASLAARAAAELSSQGRITRQQSAESRKAFASVSRDGPQNHSGSKLQGEHLTKDPTNNSFYERKSRMHHERSDGNEQDDLAGLTERFYNLKSSDKLSQAPSSKFNNASLDDCSSVNDLQMSKGHSRKSSSELVEASVMRESSESEGVDFGSEVENGMKSENVGYFEEARIRKQSSDVSSSSHSRTFSDDHNVFSNVNQHVSGGETDKYPFIIEKEIQRDAKGTNYYDNAMVSDDFGSENEMKFDLENEHEDQEYGSIFSSEGRESSSHLLANTNGGAWQNIDESRGKSSPEILFASKQQSTLFFSEDLASDRAPSPPHDLLPMTFDDSDGAISEGEIEPDASEAVDSSSIGLFGHKENVYTRNSEPTHYEISHVIGSSLADEEDLEPKHKTHLWTSSLDSDVEEFSEKNPGTGVNVENDSTLANSNFDTIQASPIHLKFCSSSDDLNDDLRMSGDSSEKNVQSYQSPILAKHAELTEESGSELNFGTLTGGLRNKGYRHPPYRRNPSSKDATENTSRTGQSSSSSEVDIDSGANDQEMHNQRVQTKVEEKTSSRIPVTYSDDDDDSDKEVPRKNDSNSQQSFSRKPIIVGHQRSNANTFFDSENSDSEGVPKQVSTSKTLLGSGFSRRTKASSLTSGKDSSLKAPVHSKPSASVDFVVEKPSSSSSSYSAETQVQPQARSSDYEGSPEQRMPKEQAVSKRIQQPKRSSHEESNLRSSYGAEIQQNPSSRSKSSGYQASPGKPRSAEDVAPKSNQESKRSSHEESNLRSSYGAEIQQNPSSRSRSSGYQASPGKPRSAEDVAPKSNQESKRSSHEESNLRSSYGAEIQQNPSSRSKSSGYQASPGKPRSAEDVAPKSNQESKRSLREESNLRSSYGAEIQQNSSSRSKSSGYQASPGKPRSAEDVAPKSNQESKRSLRDESLKSSAQQQPFDSRPKPAAPGRAGSSNASSTHSETAIRENSINRASHVHPKLPDYDTFAAHLLSLRQNRQ